MQNLNQKDITNSGPQKKLSVVVAKTKKAAVRTVGFVWNGIFNTEVVRTIEPGKTESLRINDAHRNLHQYHRPQI